MLSSWASSAASRASRSGRGGSLQRAASCAGRGVSGSAGAHCCAHEPNGLCACRLRLPPFQLAVSGESTSEAAAGDEAPHAASQRQNAARPGVSTQTYLELRRRVLDRPLRALRLLLRPRVAERHLCAALGQRRLVAPRLHRRACRLPRRQPRRAPGWVAGARSGRVASRCHPKPLKASIEIPVHKRVYSRRHPHSRRRQRPAAPRPRPRARTSPPWRPCGSQSAPWGLRCPGTPGTCRREDNTYTYMNLKGGCRDARVMLTF